MVLELTALVRSNSKSWTRKHDPVLVEASDIARRWARLKAWIDEEPEARSFFVRFPDKGTGLCRGDVDRLVDELDDTIRTRNALLEYATAQGDDHWEY